MIIPGRASSSIIIDSSSLITHSLSPYYIYIHTSSIAHLSLLLLLSLIFIYTYIHHIQEICRALVEADVNIKVVSTMRNAIKNKVNLEEAAAGRY